MEYRTYSEIVKHLFVDDLLKSSSKIKSEIVKPAGFKIEAEYKREPTEKEYYCLELGHSVAHLLTVIQ